MYTYSFFVDTYIFINMKKVKVICENPDCGIEFDKPKNEYNRSIKLGRKLYCSRSCSGKCSNQHLRDYNKENTKYLISNNRRDKYTGLREHMRRVRQRSKDFDVTLEDLLQQWEKQGGRCVYSGVKLTHPIQRKNENLMYTASLDRIDSSKGYVKDNIQFISVVCNHAKGEMSHEEMLEFCEILSSHIKKEIIN